MPFRSERQRRAMHAAAAGRSTIGIPRRVGQRFVADSQPRTIVELAAKRRKHKRGRRR